MSELFSSYFSKLFCICACSLVCEIVCNSISVKNNSVGQGVKIICSLCVCMVVFSAFFNRCDFAQSINNISNNFSDLSGSIQTSQTENTLIESVKLQIESEISHDIIKKTGIKPESVSIQLNIKNEDKKKIVDFKKTYISLPESTSGESIYFIKNYVQGILGCDAQITGVVKE